MPLSKGSIQLRYLFHSQFLLLFHFTPLRSFIFFTLLFQYPCSTPELSRISFGGFTRLSTMFYSQQVLTKKGPLAKIWLAAHMQSKLTKAMVFSTDLRKAVESIISPEVPMALRLTSNLLLGVVRILHRKSKYLLQESSDAMTRLKLAFHPTSTTNLSTRQTTTANYNAITVQPALDSFDAPNLDLEVLPARTAPAHASFLAADRDITIDEFAGGLVGGMLDAFAVDIDLDRQDGMDSDANLSEPLLFTPSQRPIRQSPAMSSVRSDPSVEMMRAEDDVGTAGQTPRLSSGPPSTLRLRRDVEHDDNARQGRVRSSNQSEEPEVPRHAETPVALTEQVPFTPPSKPDTLAQEHDSISIDPSSGNGNVLPEMQLAYPVESPEDRVEQTLAESDVPPPVVPYVPRVSTSTDDLTFAVNDVPAVLDDTLPPGGSLSATPAQHRESLDPGLTSAGEPQMNISQSSSLHTERVEGAPTQRGSPVSEEWQPTSASERSSQIPESPVATDPSRVRERKRKAHVLIDEGATELSTTDFRACLHDTSDLIRGPRAPVRRRVDSSLRQVDSLGLPSYLMAPPLRQLFEESFRYAEVVSSPMSDAATDQVSRVQPSQQESGLGQEDNVAQKEGTSVKSGSNLKESEFLSSPVQDVQAVEEAAVQAPGTCLVGEETGDVPFVLPGLDAPESNLQDDSSAVAQVPVPPLEGAEGDTPLYSGPKGGGMEERLRDVQRDLIDLDTGATVEGTSSSKGASRAADVPEPPQLVSTDFHAESGNTTLRDVALAPSQVERAAGEDVTEATLSARGQKMKKYIEEHVVEAKLIFTRRLMMERGLTKRTASRTFYEILNLSNKRVVRLTQEAAYSDIYVEPIEPHFSNLGTAS